jgi:hypothetical protein
VQALRLLSVVCGGVPAVLLVAQLVPQPADELGATLRFVLLWLVGATVSGALYVVLMRLRRR